jgi:amino acid transporter
MQSSSVQEATTSSSRSRRRLPATRPELPAGQLPTGWLPNVMRPRDLTVLCLFAVLLITNVQSVASGGAISFLYWGLGFLLFLIPSALVSAQLYRLFPGEGAVYLWANKAFGNFWDTFLGLFCNWWPGAIGLTVEAGAVVSSVQALNGNWLALPWQQGLVEILALIIAQVLCYLGQRVLQRILNVVFYAYACVFALIGLCGVLWLLGGHRAQADFSAAAWHFNPSNYPLFAVVIVALLGMAIPLNLGAEVVDRRRGHTYLLWGTAIIIIGYLFATFGVLVVLSSSEIKSPAFIGLVFQHVFGPALGNVLAVLSYVILVGYFVCATAAYNLMFSRLLLVASVDRRLPRGIRKLNANKVPFNAMMVQTVLSALFIAILFFIVPSSSANPQLSLSVFLIVLNGAAVVWYVAMIGLFLSGILLCVRYRSQLTGRWVVPPFVLHLTAACGTIVSAVAIYGTFFGGSPVPDVINNQDWIFWVLLSVLASLTIGAAYSFLVPEAEDLVMLIKRSKEKTSAQNDASPVPAPTIQEALLRSGELQRPMQRTFPGSNSAPLRSGTLQQPMQRPFPGPNPAMFQQSVQETFPPLPRPPAQRPFQHSPLNSSGQPEEQQFPQARKNL